MHRIYANSYFTLAATKATSATDGFLQKRPHMDRIALPYGPDPMSNPEGYYYASIVHGHWLKSDHDKYVEDSKWNSRGWTLQERILSKRVLHFTSHILYYECRCLDWAEDNRPAYLALNRTPWLGSGWNGYYEDGYVDPLSLTDIYYSWYRLVEYYAVRVLTRSEDKLPAMSGLAHEMAKLSGDEYLAGLWKEDLSTSLVWYTTDPHSRPAESYRAPSWSWAQIDGRVTYSDEITKVSEHQRRCFTLIRAHIVAETQDLMGHVRSGQLTINAKVKEITAIRRTPKSSKIEEWNTHLVYRDGLLVALGRLDSPDIDLVERRGVFALPIAKQDKTRYGAVAILQGLIIEATNSAPCCFRRIGLWSIFGNSAVVDFFDDATEREICLI